MEGETKLPLSHRPRTGSDTRKKQRVVTFRVTDEEHAVIRQNAGRLTVGTYLRDCAIKTPVTARRQRPLADVAALSKLIAELGRFGSNLNQIARAVHLGELAEARALVDMRDAVLKTLKAARAAMGFEA